MEAAMKLLLFVLGIGVAVFGIGTRAEAQNYPWCALYDSGSEAGIADSADNCCRARARWPCTVQSL